MPFLSIFRKDKDPLSPSSFSRARSRPSVASSRGTSPPPQLGDISPQSDLSYVLPELEEFQTHKPEEKQETVKKRAVLHRRRESTQTIPSRTSTSPRTSTTSPRPLSEALIDRVAPTNPNRNLTFDSDDDPLVPPPPRASVFAGYSHPDQDRPRAQSESPRPQDDMKRAKKDGAGRGLFGWRKAKDVTVVTEPVDSSFSLKSFRHVGPPSPVVKPEESTASLPVDSPTTGASSSSTARPVPGRSAPAARERVNSTSSEGMMTAGLFRLAARRSSTNLVEEAAEPVRSRMRDLEKRGPPTRSWAEDSTISSSSDRPGPRKSPPDTSSRPTLDNKPHKSLADMNRTTDDEPESPSPFAGRLGDGRTSPFTTRSESGHGRVDYSMYGARSDGAVRSKLASSRAQSPPPKPVVSRVFSASPAQITSSLPNAKPGPQGYTGPRTSPTKPRPSSPEKLRAPSSPTKPRLSAPAATRPTRSPIRTTIPTKTNDGPSIKPAQGKMPAGQGKLHRRGSGSSQSSIHAQSSNRRAQSPIKRAQSPVHRAQSPTRRAQSPVRANQSSMSALGHGRKPSVSESMRSVTFDPVPHSGRPSTDTLAQMRTRRPSAGALSQSHSAGLSKSQSNVGLAQSHSNTGLAQSHSNVGLSQPHSNAGLSQSRSNVALQSQSQDSFSQSRAGVGAMRGRHGKDTSLVGKVTGASVGVGKSTTPIAGKNTTLVAGKNTSPVTSKSTSPATTQPSPAGKNPSLGTPPKESTSPGMGNRSATQGGQHSRSNSDDQPGLTRERTITQRDQPRIGVSLFDGPVPRTRASHSTSAISAAATARNAATLAEANRAIIGNRPGQKHTRVGSFGASRAPAVGTDTDEDEDESEESSEDDAPLSSLAPAKRPGSAASTASAVRPGPRPSLPTPQSRATAPLINIPGVTSPPPRPPRINRVPGVGVTRNSSLRGSRSVEDLGRMPAVRPGPRPFVTSPPSSTGDSSSGKAPLTPRDGSEAGRDRSDEARRKERRRSEAKKSVELGNVINGPGPIPDDEDEDNMSMGHSQLGHAAIGMMGMGWNQSGFFPPGGAGFGGGFPTSQSMPFLHPQMTGQPMPPMGFMPPPPPPGAPEAYLQAHQQAMMIAKQTYLSAVAQQAMAAATEQWERSSNMGGSVYGGSQVSVNMGMAGMPMMSMYAGSTYAASAYEGSVAGWGSASAYGGPSGPRSVYGGVARSELGGGMKTKPGAGPNRIRGKPQTGSDSQPRRDPVPPSTWATRRKAGL
ncbi:hypothetical protein FRC11_000963 [Ceratobasidium sp. 423]|nr:hypothetical protein FRC11_000963 [Ceratobasidium sp. 423]